MPALHPALPADGKLAANIAHFARALRKAGLPVGTGRVLEAIRAVEAVGFGDRRDFYFTLQACFVSRPEHREVFAQVFRLFWRDPQFMERMMALLVPLGIALNGTSSVLYATVADLVTAERRSRAYGLYYTLSIGASALGPTLYGLVGDAVGAAATLSLIALVVLTTIPLCLALRPAVAAPARS